MKQTILVTGGAGYIGSHMVFLLIQHGYNPVVLDNFCTSSMSNLDAVAKLTKHSIEVIEHDLQKPLVKIRLPKVDAVIHLAALKAVGESMANPLEYYRNNVGGTINLLSYMQSKSIRKLIFSSTAAVYSPLATMPLTESSPVAPQSPYGQSKLIAEKIIEDVASTNALSATCLRYFNVAGNIATAEFGEPKTAAANLVPAILSSHFGYRRAELEIFGTDYDTRDGSALRDYIHVLDLCEAHIAALKKLDKQKGSTVYNLGSGKGTTVKELIIAFEKEAGTKLHYKLSPRREGDLAVCYADSTKAKQDLNWEVKHTTQQIVSSAYSWWQG